MKRKVQAQRKFAQGAYIPPSVSSSLPAQTQPEKRPDPAADQRNVFYNTMSANSLLDIVAFQKIHTHQKEAVIILERIENKKQAPTAPATRPVQRNNNHEARRPPRSSASAAQKNNMQLRSKIRMNYKTFKPVTLKRKNHKNKVEKNKAVVTKRKVSPRADSYDVEDDRPLKYFMRYVRGSETIGPDIIRRGKRTRENDTSRVARARKRILASPIMKRPFKLSLRHARPSPQAKASLRAATKTYEPEIADQQLSDFDDAATTASENAPLKPPPRDCPSPNHRKEDHQCCPSNSKKSVSMHVEAKPSTSGYSSSVDSLLEGWLNNVEKQRERSEDGHFKVPLVPPRRKPEPQAEVTITNSTREPPPCPSESSNPIRLRDPSPCSPEPIILNSSRGSSPCPSDAIILNYPRDSSPCPSDAIILNYPCDSSPCPSDPIILNFPRDSSPCPTDSIILNNSRDFSPCPAGPIALHNSRNPLPCPSEPIILNNSRNPSPCPSDPNIPNNSRNPSLCPTDPIILNNSRNPSPCPSERYTSMRDIVDAADSDVKTCGHVMGCTSCQRVNQVRMLKRMVEIPLKTCLPDTNDVYEFNDSDDEMENPRLNYRQNRKAGKHHDMPSSTRDDDEQPLYLDILPKSKNLSGHIIQILPKKLPNQSKPIMTARLVPKSKSVMGNQFSLIEHGHMLDQLSKMNVADLSEIFDGLVERNLKKRHEEQIEKRRSEGDKRATASLQNKETSKEAQDRDLPSHTEGLHKTKPVDVLRSIVDKFDLSLQERINLSKSGKSRTSRANEHNRKRSKEKGRKKFRSNGDEQNNSKDDSINVDKSDDQNDEDFDKMNPHRVKDTSRISDKSFDQDDQSKHIETCKVSSQDESLQDVEDNHTPSTNKVTKRHKAEGQGKTTNRSAEKDNGKKGHKRSNESYKKPDHLFKKCKGRCKQSDPGCSAWHSPDPHAGILLTNRESLVLEAPVFYPTEAEFKDPLSYIDKIMMTASKYGLCKVVAPQGFKPQCFLSDEIRFNVASQYIARLYSRWGPAAREMCAIKFYLASQSVPFSRSPLFEGIEVNLPKLYHIVQRNGGLKNVIEKKRWGRVAEEMRFTKGPNTEKRVDQLYVKYLLPYDMLADKERQELLSAMERYWNKKNKKLLERALNPLHRQKRLLGESESSGEDTEEEGNLAWALSEAEDCVIAGRNMNLSSFKKVAANAMDTLFPRETRPCPAAVEEEYWRLVLHGTDHVGVYSASIDTGEEGYGFTKNKSDDYGSHPWNLKMLSENSGNVLRSLGPVLGVTVPTLHLGMVFSTSCWHRDPHGLPWIEYMHSGPTKIWYGIPDEQSDKFRRAVETLCPTSCQNKSIWLPSDITMIPPNLLREHKVSLSRIEQRPGEFIIVFPKAYSCSICTGFTQSESVYFATISWLKSVTQVFQEVRDSCEPTMFSLEQLLIAVARDPRSPLRVLPQVHHNLSAIVTLELEQRQALAELLTPPAEPNRQRNAKKRPAGAWNVREQDECEICRTTLYLSKVTGLTGKRTSVCLTHALRLIDLCESDDAELVVFYTTEELEQVLATVQKRLLV